MKTLDSVDQLTAWDDYREHMKMSLKLLEPGGACFVSKDKVEFDVRGKPWSGHAFLAGKNAAMSVQRLRKEGLAFREGVCSADGKELQLSDLPSPMLVKEVAKTLLKLQLGYKVAGVAEGNGEAAPPQAEGAGASDPRQQKVAELQKLAKDLERLLAALK